MNKPKKSKKRATKATKKSAAPAGRAATTAKQSDPNAADVGANGKPAGKLIDKRGFREPKNDDSGQRIYLFHFIFFFFKWFPGEKQYSILELLELQARARAIRSQLALEPVTKIELDDSDEDTVNKNKNPEPTQPPAEVSTNDKNETQTNVTEPVTVSVANKETIEPAKSTANTAEQPRVPSSRPIRLKRNFRPRQIDEEEVSVPAPENRDTEKSAEKSPAKTPEQIEEKANEIIATSVKLWNVDR